MTSLARCFLVIGIVGAGTSMTCADETLTFDELSFRPVDGVSVKHVTFDFKIDGVDSVEAHYASFGSGALQ